MIQQPELGKKIADLRKSKGLTQEELVELCNISVRTIQRIETGEVTPRSYTIKTILNALDSDIKTIYSTDNAPLNLTWWQRIFLSGISEHNTSPFIIKQLSLAWIAGIIYFVSGFPESVGEYFRFTNQEIIFGLPVYVIIKLVVLISYIWFMRGMFLVGFVFKNTILKVISIFLILMVTLTIVFDISTASIPANENFLYFPISISYGVLTVIYGIALITLNKNLGIIALLAGIFELIAGLFFIPVIFFGFIFQLPAEILEVMLIYKTIEIVKQRSEEN